MFERVRCERSLAVLPADARRRRQLLGRLMLLHLLVAGPAGALDFSSEHLVYREDYEGETSYPTTPEVDLLGIGGLAGGAVGMSGPVSGQPSLTGGAARAFVSGSFALVEYTSGVAVALTFGDFGLRGEFENLVVVGDGKAVAVLDAFAPAPAYELLAVLEVVRAGAAESASLVFTERVDGFDTGTASVALSGAEATALLSGAAFTVDFFVDRVGVTGLASVEVAGFAGASQVVLSLTAPVGVPFAVFQMGGHDGANPPSSVQLDMTAFEFYDALPRSFNVDVGDARGTPSASYGAAGPAGTWNTVGLGTSSLVDVDGNTTAATVTLTTQFDLGTTPGGTPDAGALFGDHGLQCGGNPDAWALEFAGLAPGRYRVIVYAPAQFLHQTGALDVNGIALPPLQGDTGFALIEGMSWSRVATTTADGSLGLSGEEFSMFGCAGIAGVQLVALPPSKVPLLSGPALALLVSLLACGGVVRARRRSAGALAALLLLVAGPAGALDFSSDHLVYSEDFEGETSYPTTPELDLISAGGLCPGGYRGPLEKADISTLD